jgi:hypothetical protein
MKAIWRVLCSAIATAALTVMAEDVALAQECDVLRYEVLRAPTAEEQKFYVDAFAQFQKIAPPAPAGWTTSDEPSTSDRKEVCAAPGKPYLMASFSRNYNRNAEEVRQRQVEAEGKAVAFAKENQAAMKAGTLNWETYQAALGKITAESERDNVARFRFRMGGNDPTPAGSGSGFSPVTVPVGKGYRQVSDDSGGMPVTLMIVVNPAPAKSSLTVMFFEGDPARVDAMLKAASFR